MPVVLGDGGTSVAFGGGGLKHPLSPGVNHQSGKCSPVPKRCDATSEHTSEGHEHSNTSSPRWTRMF